MRSLVKFIADAAKLFAILALLAILAAAPASAQKKNKKDQTDAAAQAASNDVNLLRSDTAAVEQTVSEFLGYWQIGDAEMLHHYYADNVVIVSGAWEPPIVGWSNYLTAYQLQRSHTSSSRMDRSNTVSNVIGNTAWVTYQWTYTAVVDNLPSISHGHTSLVLNKQGGRWVIVLNHTSAVDAGSPAPAGTPVGNLGGSAQPGRP